MDLRKIMLVFAGIGCTAVGGYIPLMSMVEREWVEKRQEITSDELSNAIALANLLPGPIAVNVVAWVGYKLRGYAGAMIATAAVIFPSLLIMLTLTGLYLEFQTDMTANLLRGFLPALAAIVFGTALRMGRKTFCKGSLLIDLMIIFASVILMLVTPPSIRFFVTLGVLFIAAITGILSFRRFTSNDEALKDTLPASLLRWRIGQIGFICLCAVGVMAGALSFDWHPTLKLAGIFSGASVQLFGGAFVFIPVLEEIVVSSGWVSSEEFLQAAAVGQVLPGPNLVCVAFVGYRVAGLVGAFVSILGIFGPPAIIMILASKATDSFMTNRHVQAAMRGVRLSVIGLIAAASWSIFQTGTFGESGDSTSRDFLVSSTLFLLSFVALEWWKIGMISVFLVAGLCGFLLYG